MKTFQSEGSAIPALGLCPVAEPADRDIQPMRTAVQAARRMANSLVDAIG